MEGNMAIQLTAEEAAKAGHPKATEEEVSNKAKDGIVFDNPQVNYVCYVGPCQGPKRLVCYSTPSGCNECYWVRDICS